MQVPGFRHKKRSSSEMWNFFDGWATKLEGVFQRNQPIIEKVTATKFFEERLLESEIQPPFNV